MTDEERRLRAQDRRNMRSALSESSNSGSSGGGLNLHMSWDSELSLAAFRALLDECPDEILGELENELTKAAYNIMREAKRECPVNHGRLRASGTVAPAKRTKDSVSIRLGFGTNYGAYVHENLTAKHKTGKAKFLEDPMKRWAPEIPKLVAKAVDKVTERRGRA